MSEMIKPEALVKQFADAYIHQDRIIFQQIRTLMASQGAVIAAIYLMKGTEVVWWAAGVGIVFTVMVYLFIHKTRQDREGNRKVINALLDKFCEPDLKEVLPKEVKDGRDTPNFRTANPTRWGFAWLPGDWVFIVQGHFLMQITVLAFISMDLWVANYLRNYAPPPVSSALHMRAFDTASQSAEP